MCVIIHKPAGVEFSPEDVAGAFQSNSHGFGVMFLDKETKQIVAKKKLLKDLREIQSIFKDLTPENAVFHFRIKTHGPTNDMFCHPFQVLNKKEHGHDMWMMHNGVIGKARNSANESDTYAYCRDVLTKQLAKDFDRIEDEWFKDKVESEIGGSKFVFLDDTGRIVKYNEKYGDEYKDCWVSNKSFVPVTGRIWNYEESKWDWPNVNNGQDYPRRVYNNNRNNKSNDTVTVLGAPCRLRGVVIKPDDKVHILSVMDPNFYALGTIHAVEGTYFQVKYNDPITNAEHWAMFYNGGMTGENSHRRLQCIPENFGLKPKPNTFMETGAWVTDQGVHSGSAPETQTVLALEDKTKPQTKETTMEKIETTEKKADESVQEGVAVIHEGNPTIEFVGTKPLEILMDYKDCRWGGWDGGIEAFTCYGGELDPGVPETTLLDIHNMEPQDRLEFFCRYPETAFGIFQDLLEQTISDDPEVQQEGEEEESEVSVEATREAMLG